MPVCLTASSSSICVLNPPLFTPSCVSRYVASSYCIKNDSKQLLTLRQPVSKTYTPRVSKYIKAEQGSLSGRGIGCPLSLSRWNLVYQGISGPGSSPPRTRGESLITCGRCENRRPSPRVARSDCHLSAVTPSPRERHRGGSWGDVKGVGR